MKHYSTIHAGQNPSIEAFVVKRCGVVEGGFGAYNALWFNDSRGLKVALLYNNFHWPNIAIHVASRPGALWCWPEMLWHIFAYPFIQLNCNRVTAPVDAVNTASCKLVSTLGFKEEGRLREAGRNGEDILLYGMLKRECRWIANEQRRAE